MAFHDQRSRSALNLDCILSEIKEEVKRRGTDVYAGTESTCLTDSPCRRETVVWIKIRKIDMRLRDSRFYLLVSPFVSILKFLFKKLRYKSELCVSDLIRLSDEDFLKACYFKILGRKPDNEGLNHHLVVLQTGKNDKIGVINSFIRSKEARHRKARIEGLSWYNLRRFFVKIPILGYFIRIIFSIIMLPKRLKEISASIDRISANIDSISREQLCLKKKIDNIKGCSDDNR